LSLSLTLATDGGYISGQADETGMPAPCAFDVTGGRCSSIAFSVVASK
jgi:hypothetical protein